MKGIHLVKTEIENHNSENKEQFICEDCNYKCNFIKHLYSIKHHNFINKIKNTPLSSHIF